jgi:hypothetical protein
VQNIEPFVLTIDTTYFIVNWVFLRLVDVLSHLKTVLEILAFVLPTEATSFEMFVALYQVSVVLFSAVAEW